MLSKLNYFVKKHTNKILIYFILVLSLLLKLNDFLNILAILDLFKFYCILGALIKIYKNNEAYQRLFINMFCNITRQALFD